MGWTLRTKLVFERSVPSHLLSNDALIKIQFKLSAGNANADSVSKSWENGSKNLIEGRPSLAGQEKTDAARRVAAMARPMPKCLNLNRPERQNDCSNLPYSTSTSNMTKARAASETGRDLATLSGTIVPLNKASITRRVTAAVSLMTAPGSG